MACSRCIANNLTEFFIKKIFNEYLIKYPYLTQPNCAPPANITTSKVILVGGAIKGDSNKKASDVEELRDGIEKL